MDLVKCPPPVQQHSDPYGPGLDKNQSIPRKGTKVPKLPRKGSRVERKRGTTELSGPKTCLWDRSSRSMFRMWSDGPLCPKLSKETKAGSHKLHQVRRPKRTE